MGADRSVEDRGKRPPASAIGRRPALRRGHGQTRRAATRSSASRARKARLQSRRARHRALWDNAPLPNGPSVCGKETRTRRRRASRPVPTAADSPRFAPSLSFDSLWVVHEGADPDRPPMTAVGPPGQSVHGFPSLAPTRSPVPRHNRREHSLPLHYLLSTRYGPSLHTEVEVIHSLCKRPRTVPRDSVHVPPQSLNARSLNPER